MITITPAAQEKIKDVLLEESAGGALPMLRIFVQGGGCAGFSYGFTLDDASAEDDLVTEVDTFKVLIDAASLMYLTGAVLDYKEDLMGSQFTINNPNATTTCGCGSSFAA